MNSKKIKVDFHNHPLCHKYYPANKNMNNNIILSKRDKSIIERYIKWCIETRGLDAVAITDHDLIQSSLYAREYVEKNNLPIKVITGAECELDIRIDYQLGNKSLKMSYAHILALGVTELPKRNDILTVEEVEQFIDEIHKLGGIAVMAHPIFSKIVFYNIAHVLDGFEILNRDTYAFNEGSIYCKNNNLSLKEYKNSDYHHEASDKNFAYYGIPLNCNYESESFINKLLHI